MSWSIPQPDDAAILRAKQARVPDEAGPTPSWSTPELPPSSDRAEVEDDIWCTD
jgi:hypothetical protein